MIKTPEELDPTGKFVPYFGNHHRSLPPPESRWGGSVYFRDHLDRPLSDRLWEDITTRLGAKKLLVYQHGDEMWLMGWGAYTCVVHLGEDGTVRDIEWYPDVVFDISKGTYQTVGAAIGNMRALARADFS